MNNIKKRERKINQKIKIIRLMINLYCKKHEKNDTLCKECKELLDYSILRTNRCPFIIEGTFCSNCKKKCYRENMKKKMKKVMRFSGPRLMFYHPIVLFKHMIQSMRTKLQK